MTATIVSLYTGAGGLDLGLHAAGFKVKLCVEIDDDARSTLRKTCGWPVADPGDVHELLASGTLHRQAGLRRGEVTLLAGGPPCQPWSKSGNWIDGTTKRLTDPRASTLHAYLQVVEELLPEVLLLENVRGLALEGQDDAMSLLRKGFSRINKKCGTRYAPAVLHLNAADYGAPQLRERLFVVAHRGGILLSTPPPTHGDEDKTLLRRCTAWDALAETKVDDADPALKLTGRWADLIPSIPEGKNYLWHTPEGGGQPLFGWRTRFWSFLLNLAKAQPAWTIPANPGPATGPFHWKNRLLATVELARLQTFPAEFAFCGNNRSALRQIGNAVPPLLGEMLGLAIRRDLLGENVQVAPTKFVIPHRNDCPPPESVARVPRRLLALRGEHKPHPGEGKGPNALLRTRAGGRP